jgi:hypothetical protein
LGASADVFGGKMASLVSVALTLRVAEARSLGWIAGHIIVEVCLGAVPGTPLPLPDLPWLSQP